MSGCPFESIPYELFLCVLDFVPLLDYYCLKLAGSRRIAQAVRDATPRISRGEYSQKICKEYKSRYGQTCSAIEIQIKRDQEALVRYYLRKYQHRHSRRAGENEFRHETVKRGLRSALNYAAYYGSVSVASLLLANIETRCAEVGNTPLHIAADFGHVEVVDLFVANGARLDVLNFDGKTPLQLALENKREAVATLLESKGAAANLDQVREIYKESWGDLLRGNFKRYAIHPISTDVASKREQAERNHRSFRPVRLVSKAPCLKPFSLYVSGKASEFKAYDNRRLKSLVMAIITHDHPTLLSSILDDGFSMHTALDQRGDTVLHVAVRLSRVSITKMLLERKTDGVPLHSVRNTAQRTPLHVASDPEIFRLLLEHGADANATDSTGCSLLHTPYCQPDTIQLFLEYGADPNATNSDGRTLSHLTSETKIVQLLLEHGADANARDRKMCTPLHVASNIQIVKLLLQHGADVNATDFRGSTPLHSLITKFSSESSLSDIEKICDLLLSRGADLNAKDDSQRTPLKLAVRHQPRLVRKLLKCDIDVTTLNSPDGPSSRNSLDSDYGKSPIQRLLDHERDPQFYSLSSSSDQPPICTAVQSLDPEPMEELVDHGADVHWMDSDGLNLLFYALQSSQRMVSSLIKHGVDVNGKDSFGNTPLFPAVFLKRTDLVCTLVENGALANASNCLGYTPLHYVVREYTGPTKEVIKALMDHGADVNARAGDGSTPIHVATRRDRNHHIVKLLLEYGADVNARDGKGETPLHCMVLQKAPFFGDVLKTLLSYGARVDEHDQDGFTPVDAAMDLEREEYVNILLGGSKAK